MINFIILTVSEAVKGAFPNAKVAFVRQKDMPESFAPNFDIVIDGKQSGLIFETKNINKACTMAVNAPIQIIQALINEIANRINATS